MSNDSFSPVIRRRPTAEAAATAEPSAAAEQEQKATAPNDAEPNVQAETKMQSDVQKPRPRFETRVVNPQPVDNRKKAPTAPIRQERLRKTAQNLNKPREKNTVVQQDDAKTDAPSPVVISSTPDAPQVATPAPQIKEAPAQTARSYADKNAPMPSTDDFAAMFGETSFDFKDVQTGDRVTAIIVSIDEDNVFVDLGAKAEGSVSRNDLKDKDGNLPYVVGDSLELYVVSTRGGNIQLSNALRQTDAGIDMLAEAHAQQIPVEGRVTGVNKGGFDVEVIGKRAFCPMSQLTDFPIDTPEDFIGTTHNFLINRIDDNARNIVVSARALKEAEREQRAAQLLKTLKEGDQLAGTVSRVTDFGAFIDLGGVDGLVHVSEMTWSRPDHPSEVVREGQIVQVKVVRIETDDKGQPRIGLSMKALEDDPFVQAMQNIQIGESVKGAITRITNFGAFVELAPGFEGLIHISELAPGRRVQHPSQIVTEGDIVEAQVLDLDPQQRRVSLSMARLMDDPWAQAAVEFPPGTPVQGTVEAAESFGAFVALENGLRALLPWSQLAPGEDRSQHKIFGVGSVIEARVLDVDVARARMSLTRTDSSAADQEAADVRAQLRKQQQQDEGFGTFADLLKNHKL